MAKTAFPVAQVKPLPTKRTIPGITPPAPKPVGNDRIPGPSSSPTVAPLKPPEPNVTDNVLGPDNYQIADAVGKIVHNASKSQDGVNVAVRTEALRQATSYGQEVGLTQAEILAMADEFVRFLNG